MTIIDTRQKNDSIVHPLGFYVIGFSTLPFANLYLIFLAFVYVVTALFNGFIIVIIWLEQRLHTPKYIAVANLAVIDLVLSTVIIPGMIKTFLVKDNFVSFNACLTQMYFYYAFVSLESFSLSVLAYDRLVAICFPLRQHSINTTTNMAIILLIIWVFCVGITVFTTSIMTHLSFCNKTEVYSYFCDYAPVFRLACNDYRMQWTAASTLSMIIIFGPLSFIITSYTCILIAVFRMKSVETRFKALATCTEHLILVAIFYVPILVLFIMGFYVFAVDPDIRMLNLSLASCVPPLMNPIVYTLKTKEIRSRVFFHFQKMYVFPKL